MSTNDTAEYINALRTSSDRARYVLYIVVVTTVLTFVIHHNIKEESWPRRRLDTWYRYARDDKKGKPVPQSIARGDAERLNDLRDEYTKQFASRGVMTASPIPGVFIDINDLGLTAGMALAVLMLLLAAAIAREHENLYLALYKVRLLCVKDGRRSSSGGSRANLLYHALAMTQMLNSPPTLARWRQRPTLASLGRVVFVAPSVVYWRVVRGDIDTSNYSFTAYNVIVDNAIVVEIALAVAICILGIVAWAHTSAMAERWSRAFLRINPARRTAPQMPLWEWLRIRVLPLTASRLARQRLAGDIVDNLHVVVTDRSIPIMVKEVIACVNGRIGWIQRWQMKRRLIKRGAAAARLIGLTQPNLLHYTVVSSRVQEDAWTVVGAWSVVNRRHGINPKQLLIDYVRRARAFLCV